MSPSQSLRLCEHFVAGTPVRTAADLIGVNKNTAALFYRRLREIIAEQVENDHPSRTELEREVASGEASRTKASLEIAGKKTVVEILRRNDRVYTRIVADDAAAFSLPHHRTAMMLEAAPHAAGASRGGSGTINDAQDDPSGSSGVVSSMVVHDRGAEDFWNHAKRQLRKYNGVPQQNFRLFLKECEWRFNTESHAALLKTLKSWIKDAGRIVS